MVVFLIIMTVYFNFRNGLSLEIVRGTKLMEPFMNTDEKGMPLKLIVIIPAYNEQERIQETISSILAEKQSFTQENIRLYLYVIDDGSKDETRSVAVKAGVSRHVVSVSRICAS